MTISSSLRAGVTGLAANAGRLATISDNIANSSTLGYKRAVTDFTQMVVNGSSGSGRYTAGGVSSSAFRVANEGGAITGTSNATDLAVSGRGFLPVTAATPAQLTDGQLPLQLTSTGSFEINDAGYLQSPQGKMLLGWPANFDGSFENFPRDTVAGLEPVRVNMSAFTGSATTEIDLAVNLPATGTEDTGDGLPEEMTLEYFDNLGKPEALTITFTPTVPAAGDPATNEWAMTIADSASGGAVIGDYTLTFADVRDLGGTLAGVADTVGGAYDAQTGSITVTADAGPIQINIGEIGDGNGTTQLSDVFAPVQISKDGNAAGNMTGVDVDDNGYLRAQYDNGITRVLYQIPLVDVPDANAMNSATGQAFEVTRESGGFLLWNAGDGPTGTIANFALQESATDVAKELTDLIQTQRAYSSNAKIVQTVDEMLQETTNLKR